MRQKGQAIEELQKRGKRMTQQRRMLLEVILGSDWTNCKDIYYEIRKRGPNLGMATVYRIVSVLGEMGALARTYRYSSPDSPKEEEDCQQQSFMSY